MSPFSYCLHEIRRSRGLRQKNLADLIGVGTSYVCALEAGRKGPPSTTQLMRFAAALDLNEDEREALFHAAKLSQRSVEIPADASADEFELVHALMGRLGQLTADEVQLIKIVLKMNTRRQPMALNRDAG